VLHSKCGSRLGAGAGEGGWNAKDIKAHLADNSPESGPGDRSPPREHQLSLERLHVLLDNVSPPNVILVLLWGAQEGGYRGPKTSPISKPKGAAVALASGHHRRSECNAQNRKTSTSPMAVRSRSTRPNKQVKQRYHRRRDGPLNTNPGSAPEAHESTELRLCRMSRKACPSHPVPCRLSPPRIRRLHPCSLPPRRPTVLASSPAVSPWISCC